MTINKNPFSNPQQQPVNINFIYYPVNYTSEPEALDFSSATTSLQTVKPLIAITNTVFTTASSTTVGVENNAAGLFLMGDGQGTAMSAYKQGTPGAVGYFYLCDPASTNYALIAYTGVTSQTTFTGCKVILNAESTATFSTGSILIDPRYMAAELTTEANSPQYIAFDAIDYYGQGLPKSLSTNVITQWNWDFGNGKTASGPFAVTYFWSIVPSQQIQVTLEAIDIYGKPHYCTKGLNFLTTVSSSIGISTPSLYGVQSD